MAKCIRCGKSTLMRGHIKLSDADLCTPCFRELGFTKKLTTADIIIIGSYKWNDIKDGKDAYDQRQWEKIKADNAKSASDRLGLFYADYRVLDDLECSDNEMRAVERVCALLADEQCDPKRIEYERDPGAPLSAFVGNGLLYELRYTKDVKWIRIGPDGEKKMISGPAGINKLAPKLVERYNSIK